MPKKRKKINVPEKISGHQVKKNYEKLLKDIVDMKKKERDNFGTFFLLAVNLYKAVPDHEIFNNNTFKPEFIEMIKKAAEPKKEAEAAPVEAPVEKKV